MDIAEKYESHLDHHPLQKTTSWFTQAQQVTDLFRKLKNQDEELELLKTSRLGGKVLMAHLRKKLGED
jgi:hypothetical protein